MDDVLKNKSMDREDYEFNIKELQRIIDDSPPGMQSRFAKVIRFLEAQKNRFTRIIKSNKLIPITDYKTYKKDFNETLKKTQDRSNKNSKSN